MKIKNIRLNINDLYVGRRVWLSEPGYEPLELMVKRIYWRASGYYTVKVLDRPNVDIFDAFNGMNCRLVDRVGILSTPFAELEDEIDFANENGKYLITHHLETFRVFDLYDVARKMVHRCDIQYLDPARSNVRLFRCFKHADNWGTHGEFDEHKLTVYDAPEK